MHDVPMPTGRQQTVRGFATGVIAAGAALLLSSISPPLFLVAVSLGVAIGLISAATTPVSRPRYLATVGGLLVGVSVLFLLISAAAIGSCGGTAEGCGNANPVPLLLAGLACGVAGVVAVLGAVGARRWNVRMPPPSTDR